MPFGLSIFSLSKSVRASGVFPRPVMEKHLLWDIIQPNLISGNILAASVIAPKITGKYVVD